MARSRKTPINAQIIDIEKRWKDECDNCKKSFEGGKTCISAITSRVCTVPRLIFLPQSKNPLIIPELNIHLLICARCKENFDEPVAVEDNGSFRKQKILWNKPKETHPDEGITKFCGYCAKRITAKSEGELEEIIGAIYVLPRLLVKDGAPCQLETRNSEIQLAICKGCLGISYHPLGVEQTWRFEGDVLRPELFSLKKQN